MKECTSRTAAAVIIGNELLNGKIEERNVVVLARVLRTLGIALRRIVVVPDEVPTIVQEIRSLSAAFDLVFTSGGVGPTHDDVTVEAVAQAFDTCVQVHEPTAEMIRRHFGDRLTPGHLLMARVPQGCTLVTDEMVQWPTIVMRNVWVLPGVPEIFHKRLGMMKRHLAGAEPFVCRVVHTRLDEGNLVPLLNQIVEQYPDVDVGSYPQWNHPTIMTKLTFDGLDEQAVERACEAFVRLLPEGEPVLVERDCVALSHDVG
ncbi:MAG TPA: molybdopterin-binding protein [Polyangiaceae bacterium]|jgi:molybdenum cofactor synthesis domain-containing protein|nr:MAG: NMN amidohydrolase-like protein YfaY [Deltaproteobacteria bacterium ADurb.Bin207]HNS95721.1 molybdopterin-binding protein [Polyangiaceae bacterium]HNZ21188.1 molybdopterin-binding protein [Polyangiaceae bacterium]HOD25371.1 molybdopterin-binding protein [Polyangiaceae bacterium]HOE48066.1 molybdopterin-binding protein [Polyangiaceae bacterium]